MTALLLSAVGGTGREAGVALSADHLLAVVLGGQSLEGRLDDTAAKSENQVQCRFLKIVRSNRNGSCVTFAYLLNVVVRQCPPIFKLLAGEDEALLVGRNSFLVLDLALYIVDGIR